MQKKGKRTQYKNLIFQNYLFHVLVSMDYFKEKRPDSGRLRNFLMNHKNL